MRNTEVIHILYARYIFFFFKFIFSQNKLRDNPLDNLLDYLFRL